MNKSVLGMLTILLIILSSFCLCTSDNSDNDNSGGDNGQDGLNGELDSDNDGVPDSSDKFPNDPSETSDWDYDGVGDNSDDYPEDSSYQAEIEVINSNMFHQDGYLYICGIVKNDKSKNVGKHDITAIVTIFKDDNTYFKDTEESICMYSNLVLKPGDTFPFEAYTQDPSKLGASYKIEVKASFTESKPITDIIITEDEGSYDIISGEYTVYGIVKNTGQEMTGNVEVYAAYFDSSNSLIDVESQYTVPRQLGVGEEGEVYVNSECLSANEISDYQLWVT